MIPKTEVRTTSLNKVVELLARTGGDSSDSKNDKAPQMRVDEKPQSPRIRLRGSLTKCPPDICFYFVKVRSVVPPGRVQFLFTA